MQLTTLFVGFATSVAFPLASAVAPIRNDGVLAELVIPNTYIVKYKANGDVLGRTEHEEDVDSRAKNASMRGIFDKFDVPGLQGYVAEISPSELGNLTACDLIEFIEKDTIVRRAAVAADPLLAKRYMVEQYDAPWGLARISHRARNQADYYYSDTGGEGIHVYVIDTGIRTTHTEFGGRAIWGANFVESSPNSDQDGHGTHVAGIIASKTYGVAKKATVVAVKVLDEFGSGSMSGLLQGLNWAVSDAKQRNATKKAVVNMSLSGAYTQSVNDAVKAATDAGVTVVAAAGNKNEDVANWSPGSAPSAITVGAIDTNDTRADFSNWGKGIDIFAPGVAIESAYNNTDTDHAWLSGTSMSTPHVAGLAAYFIAREKLSGNDVKTRILSAATTGVSDRKEGANRIAYNGNV